MSILHTAEGGFACHKTIKIDDDLANDTELNVPDEFLVKDDKLQFCAGSAVFLNNSFTISRDANTYEYQKQIKECSQDIKNSVFKNRPEFIEHHMHEGKQ